MGRGRHAGLFGWALCAVAPLLCGAAFAAEEAPAPRTLGEALLGGRATYELRLQRIELSYEPQFRYPAERRRALGAGLAVGYETAEWGGCAVGAVAYGAAPVDAPADLDGSGMLRSGQRGFGVLGQAYARCEAGPVAARAGRLILATPFLGPRDSLLAPVAVEGAVADVALGAGFAAHGAVVVGYKARNGTAFVAPSAAGGFETDRSLSIVGLTRQGAIGGQLWAYRLRDYFDTYYAQLDVARRLGRNVEARLSLQAFRQRAVGAALAGDARGGEAGALVALDAFGAELRGAATVASRRGTILKPWGDYPGFTSIMEEDCDIPGERAWLFGATLDLARLGAPGLVVGGDYTKAWVPDPGLGMSRLDQHESDVTLAYAFSGRLRGFAAKLRWATVRSALSAGSLNGREYRDLRFGLSYAGSVRRGARRGRPPRRTARPSAVTRRGRIFGATPARRPAAAGRRRWQRSCS